MMSRRTRRTGVATALLAAAMALAGDPACTHAAVPQPDFPPMSPEASMKAIHLHDGYRVELVAAEPLVVDPVAIDWGPDGRLWVAEMHDYPLGVPGDDVSAKDYDKFRPGGRVSVLEDTDGDGRYDKSTVFADKLTMPNGVMVWRKGVLVTSANAVLYLEDTDGDGHADVKRELFTGFAVNNPQLRINGLRYGLDNRVYLANGLTTRGDITSTKTGEKITLGARDLAIDPDSGAMDPQSGASQFGRNRDDYGNWFGVHNSYPLWHFVLDDHYTRRNPNVSMPDPKRYLILPRNPPVKFRSQFVKRYDHPHRGHLTTSTCSAMVYRDTLFNTAGDHDVEHAFTCEPFANLVMRFALTDDGVSFNAERVRDKEGYEFLSSEDGWFRPVMVRTGPDGALYVVDMYRYLIEHPQYMPEEGRASLKPFFRMGDDRGRIYRVVPIGKSARPMPRLDKLDAAGLVAMLDAPSGETRDLAQRMLIQSGDKAAVAPLSKLLASDTNPLGRLHALCTLDGLGALSTAQLIGAMSDAQPAVRRQAARIAEARGDDVTVVNATLTLADDTDAKVRQQLAYTLGEWKGDGSGVAGAALAKIALRDSGDEYMLASVMSSMTPHLDAVIDAAVTAKVDTSRLRDQLMAHAIAVNARGGAAKLMHAIVTPGDGGYSADQMRSLAGLYDTLGRRGTNLAKLRGNDGDALAAEVNKVAALLDHARQVAADTDAQPADRLAAVSLLGRDPATRDADVKRLADLLTPRTPVDVQAAAVNAVLRSGHADGPSIVLADWGTRGPSLRMAIIDGLVSHDAWAERLLAAIESNAVPARDIGAAHVDRLLKSRNKALRAHAEKVFADRATGDRAKVVAAFADVLKLKADATRGKAVFAQVCAACHRLDDVGNEIGPNLRSVTDRTPPSLLGAILDPNRNVEPRYVAYTATLNDGGVLFGVLTSETGAALTITGLDAKANTVLRTDLKSLQSTNRSLMPEGLEAGLSKQQLADVIEYISQ